MAIFLMIFALWICVGAAASLKHNLTSREIAGFGVLCVVATAGEIASTFTL